MVEEKPSPVLIEKSPGDSNRYEFLTLPNRV